MDQLKQIRAKRENVPTLRYEPRPAHASDLFYTSLFRLRPPVEYSGYLYTQALTEILKGRVALNRKLTFGDILAEAWDAGELADFEKKAHGIFEEWVERRKSFVRVRTEDADEVEERREKFRHLFEECGYRLPK